MNNRDNTARNSSSISNDNNHNINNTNSRVLQMISGMVMPRQNKYTMCEDSRLCMF